jgi:hypothetical protein
VGQVAPTARKEFSDIGREVSFFNSECFFGGRIAGFGNLKGSIQARNIFGLEREVPHLTQGEGVFITEYGGYQKVQGVTPSRSRTDHNPLNKEEYLRHVLGRGSRFYASKHRSASRVVLAGGSWVRAMACHPCQENI